MQVLSSIFFGPDIYLNTKSLLLEITVPPKVTYFLWQILSECVLVATNLRSREMNCDPRCAICGVDKEIINHVLFECPPTVETWGLSQVQSALAVFSKSPLYANLDYHFLRLPKDAPTQSLPMVLWYI